MSNELTDLVQKDAEVFEPLAKAYGLPKDTEEDDEGDLFVATQKRNNSKT